MDKIRAFLSLYSLKSLSIERRSSIVNFSDFTEKSLKDEASKIQAQRDEELSDVKSLDEFEHGFQKALWEGKIKEIEESFVCDLRYSLFVRSMSSLEALFSELCEILDSLFDGGSRFNAKRNVIEEAHSHINKIMKSLDDKPLRYDSDICLIDNLKGVRNCIVHADGYIKKRTEKKANKIRAFIKKTPTIKEDDNTKIVLLEGFVDLMTNSTFRFFLYTLDEVMRKSKIYFKGNNILSFKSGTDKFSETYFNLVQSVLKNDIP